MIDGQNGNLMISCRWNRYVKHDYILMSIDWTAYSGLYWIPMECFITKMIDNHNRKQ